MIRTAPLAKAHLAYYTIKSSDVLDELRINVLEEGTENVLWYKERTMTEDEIVESVMDSATNTLRWTIHRPTRGWYLRLRAPSFPPGTFIPFVPPAPKILSEELPTTTAPASTISVGGSTLAFSVRTLPPVLKQATPGEVSVDTSNHSYPPTPSIVSSPSSSLSLSIPSAKEINAKLSSVSQPPPKPSTITRFILYPSLPTPVTPPTGASAILSRALSFLTPTLPIRAAHSFSLVPTSIPGDIPTPLLTFTERTSTFSVATTGVLEINRGLERQMGIDPAFWITVTLAYLEFLADRDVSELLREPIRPVVAGC